MRTKLLLLILASLLLVSSVSALKVVTQGDDITECLDDGSFSIVLDANNNKDVYTKNIAIIIDSKTMKGTWDSEKLTLTNALYKKAVFKGIENQLLEAKSYLVKVAYKEGPEFTDAELNFDMECPGLLFTCQKIGLKVNDCTTTKAGDFKANVEIYGMEQSEKAILDPLKVVDYTLETQILYKDINGYTSKKGSLPAGATAKKVSDNKYVIEAAFDRVTTNHAETMFVKFNNMLPRTCTTAKYPEIILSHLQKCQYIEPEEIIPVSKPIVEEKQAAPVVEQKEEPEQEINLTLNTWENLPPEELREAVFQEITSLETKKLEIETRLKALYDKRTEIENTPEKTEDTEEAKNTGYSVKESQSETAKKSQLKILLFSLFIIVVVGGSLLAYLYKEGYFY